MRASILTAEPEVFHQIHAALDVEPDVEVLRERAAGEPIPDFVRELRPDVVFFDLQLPDGQWTDVLGLAHEPEVVIASSQQEDAVKAFEADAADFLLKPLHQSRLQSCLEKLRARFLREPAAHSAVPESKRLVFKCDGRLVFLNPDDIKWIGAEGNYVKIYAATGSYMLRQTMTNMESRLNPLQFLRVHRSAIVNMDQILEVRPWDDNGTVLLRDQTRLPLGPTCRERLSRRFQ